MIQGVGIVSCSCCTCRTTCCSTCCSDIPIAEATGCVFVGAVGEGGWMWTTTSPDLGLEGCCVWCHKQALLCVRGAYFVSPLCAASATPYASGFTVWWHPMGVCCVPECCGPLHVTWGGCAPLCVCVWWGRVLALRCCCCLLLEGVWHTLVKQLQEQ